MRILSWNVLRWAGADAQDVATMVDVHTPDLVILQEADVRLDALPGILGGNYLRHALPRRNNGLAFWSRALLPTPTVLPLPTSPLSVKPPREALYLSWDAEASTNGVPIHIVGVHLSHGQWILRRQLATIASALPKEGQAVIIGDFNSVGRTQVAGYQDVGPRAITHFAKGLLPFRLDRCLVRDLTSTNAIALDKGASDHRPILIDVHVDLK